jgi:hypothetical protein
VFPQGLILPQLLLHPFLLHLLFCLNSECRVYYLRLLVIFKIIGLEHALPQHENNNIHGVKDKRSAERLDQQIAQF